MGDYRAAIAALDRALELEPADARAHSTRGEYHRILGQYDQALADLDTAIRLDPAHEFNWASRGATWLRLATSTERSRTSTRRWRWSPTTRGR
ncbi:tetratricopeptide repeat protein [Streptomyces spongiae]|uniref:tetratricopeptide repeat protein n=1 Tax=Streptomyces spongiae TaxID=565072 RepID=UPI00223EFB38|nr:tetratricopeptide repeat protein [Streptomyces spongiae]